MQLALEAKAVAVPLHIRFFDDKTLLAVQNASHLGTSHSPPPAPFSAVASMLESEALMTEQSSCWQLLG